jgi:DNA-binding transcriptional MerR regulator
MAKSTKIYYSIGEVAEAFQVNTSLIRFWEKEFDILKPKKNKKGNRLFTERDMRYLHIIYNLVKVKGYTLQGAREVLKNDFEVVEEKIVYLETFNRIKNFLINLDKELEQKLLNQKQRPVSR